MRLRQDTPARWQQVPDGMRDLLPEEAERRSGLEARLREEFRRWGYREVLTPTLEFLDTFQHGAGPGIVDRLFKIVDRGGELLTLRPEMTVPIARLAATRLLGDAPRPLRICYVAPVFRGQEAGRGRLREFTQAGVELLGTSAADADAEVIALAVTCLRRAGVERPVLHLSDLGFLNDLLGGMAADEQDEVRGRLYRREFAGIDAAVSEPALSRFLRALPDLQGPDALKQAAPYARSAVGKAALERLAEIVEQLADYGAAESVRIDLSIIRDFSYYTGVVFEAYGPGMGYPLLGGGRYDTLLARFGVDAPATGFAIGIERVLSGVRADDRRRIDIVLGGPARRDALALARALREDGKAVVVVSAPSVEALLSEVAAFDAGMMVWVEGGMLRVIDAGARSVREMRREDFLAERRATPRVRSWTH